MTSQLQASSQSMTWHSMAGRLRAVSMAVGEEGAGFQRSFRPDFESLDHSGEVTVMITLIFCTVFLLRS